MERKGGPVALALTRQKVPTFDRREVASVEGAMRGAYTLWQSGDGEPEVILLATGSEVTLALAAARQLGRERARRVHAVLGALRRAAAGVPRRGAAAVVEARVSVEAGITFGWERWVGPRGTSVGVDRFGASAPYQRILEELGLTADAVAAAATGVLERVA